MGHIDFACKTFSIDQILRCSSNLNSTEYKILKYLMKQKGEKSIIDISKGINRDRTTAQRAIMSLLEKGVVKRRQYNLKNGGYVYYYSPKDKELIKEQVKNIFDSFNKIVLEEIEQW